MARKKQLSKEKRVAIITLRNEGQSVRKIGKTLKVSPSAVAKTIKRYKETGSHEDRPRKGRPRVTSAAEDKFIRVTSLRNRRLTAAQIRDQVNATQSSSSRHISRTTVKRRLCESGLHGRIAARKPLTQVKFGRNAACFDLVFSLLSQKLSNNNLLHVSYIHKRMRHRLK